MGRVVKGSLIFLILFCNNCGLVDFIKNQEVGAPIVRKNVSDNDSEFENGGGHSSDFHSITPPIGEQPIEAAIQSELIPGSEVVVVERSTELSQAVETYVIFDALKSAQLQKQRRETKKHYRDTQEVAVGIRYVLMLLCCDEREKNRNEALQILDELQKTLQATPSETHLIGFTQILHQLVVDLVGLKGATQAVEEQLAAKNEHIEHLEEQINALKSIEKSIHERELGTDPATSE